MVLAGRLHFVASLTPLLYWDSEESLNLVATWPGAQVENLSVVVYHNCCLESTLVVTDIPLSLPVDPSDPSSEQKDCVSKVTAEFTTANLNSYFDFVSKEGELLFVPTIQSCCLPLRLVTDFVNCLAGNRSSHYRNQRVGVSLVHFLQRCPDVFKRFKDLVDVALPGMYDWFPEATLHITVRAIV